MQTHHNALVQRLLFIVWHDFEEDVVGGGGDMVLIAQKLGLDILAVKNCYARRHRNIVFYDEVRRKYSLRRILGHVNDKLPVFLLS